MVEPESAVGEISQRLGHQGASQSHEGGVGDLQGPGAHPVEHGCDGVGGRAWMADEIVAAYGNAEDWPDDGEEFDCPISLPDDPGSEIDLEVRASMLDDLPADLFDRFDIIVSTTHDGDLGLIAAEQLDTIVQALEADGHTAVHAETSG